MNLLPPRPWTAVEDDLLLGICGTEAVQEAALEVIAREFGRSKSDVRYRRRWLVWRRNFDVFSQRRYVRPRRSSTRWSGL